MEGRWRVIAWRWRSSGSAATVYSSNAGQMQDKRGWFSGSTMVTNVPGAVVPPPPQEVFGIRDSRGCLVCSVCAERLQDPNTRLVGSVAQSALAVVPFTQLWLDSLFLGPLHIWIEAVLLPGPDLSLISGPQTHYINRSVHQNSASGPQPHHMMPGRVLR